MIGPSDLDPIGLRAFAVAATAVESLPDSERFFDAVVRFARAVQMAEKIRRSWMSEGEPLTFLHSNGALVPHPLVKMLAEAERDAMRAGKALRLDPDAVKAPPGRPKGASSASDRKAPPVIRLATREPDDAA